VNDVLYIVGARPNFMKAAPIYHELRGRLPSARQLLVHTGQHYEREMSDIFLEEFGLPDPDYSLGVGSGGHGAQTGRALERLEPMLVRERPRLVVVVGDVNSTLAGALAAVKIGIPVAHVEAGLRSFDRTMPEEINRVLVDQVAEWCFTHSPEAEDNLLREGVAAERIHFVGNTMIDTLVKLRRRIDDARVHEELGIEPGRYVLVTLHRPALVDGPLLAHALTCLAALSRELPVVFPVHPRTHARIFELPDAPSLKLIDPIGYVDFLALQARATAVITDSGGVQEETTFLGVPCFTLRAQTERPITVSRGTNRVLGLDVERILEVPRLVREATLPISPPDCWDGRAAARIIDLLLPALASASQREVQELEQFRTSANR
jgi:UDP-N-acetylglucosamine 2-epimerase (non-hydrolysing)